MPCVEVLMNRLWTALVVSAFTCACGGGGAAAAGDASVDGTSSGGSTCSFAGTWAATDASIIGGDCAGQPAFPGLHIDGDGGLGLVVDGSVVPCAVSSPSRSSCQFDGVCVPWQIATNFTDCPASFPCSAVVTDVGGAGNCSETITLSRVGP
jgi:hypothetical protein